MQIKISRPEAHSLMSESDHEVMNEKIKELEKIVGDCSNFDLNFYLDDERRELFLEIASTEQKVLYRLMFKVKKEMGRPAIGKTKKVSLTLPDEIWGKIEEDKQKTGESLSAVLRSIVEKHYSHFIQK